MYSTVGARHYVARVCQRQRSLVLSYRHPYIKTTNGRPWVEKATSICSFLIDYQNSFTVKRSSKIVIKSSLNIQLHLTCTYATKLLVKYLTLFFVHRDQWPAFWRHSVYMTEQLMVAISMNSVQCVFDYAALLPSWTTAWRHDCAGEIGRKMKICDVTVERRGKGEGGEWVTWCVSELDTLCRHDQLSIGLRDSVGDLFDWQIVTNRWRSHGTAPRFKCEDRSSAQNVVRVSILGQRYSGYGKCFWFILKSNKRPRNRATLSAVEILSTAVRTQTDRVSAWGALSATASF